MEENLQNNTSPTDTSSHTPLQELNQAPDVVCSYCHQPVLTKWYFCPNCGNKLNLAPLSTSALTQVGIYAFSIILPMVCFIFVTKWPGLKYFKSKNPKAKMIGQVAWVILIISTLLTIWLAYVWTQEAIQSSINSINADFSI
ncbi:MAG: zinc ribbon domain-containing protein [bacterium]